MLKAHDIIDSGEPKSLPLEQVDRMMSAYGIPHIAAYMFAANSRTRADRAKRVFGYQPTAPSIWDSLEADFLVCTRATA